jgi:predicted SAM-dependent methyltransferase
MPASRGHRLPLHAAVVASAVSLKTRIASSYKVQAARAAALDAVTPIIGVLRRTRLAREIRRRPELHIHFGCGEIDDHRFLNVDARPFRHVHLVTVSPLLRALPAGSAHSLYACHVLEHIPYAQQSRVLKRWRDILRPGGRLMLSVPDFDKMLTQYAATGRSIKTVQGKLMGGQDYPGNFHFALFNEAHLRALLTNAGFADIRPWHPREEHNWPKDYSWDDAMSLNLAGHCQTVT